MYDIIVIGGGPAGLTAAVYARRANKDVVVIEKAAFGGQITFSPKVENIPGFTALSGNEFAEKLVDQCIAQEVAFESATVEKVEEINDAEGRRFAVTTEDAVFEAKSVIVATGARHRMLGLERDEEFVGNGISFCAVCDGAFYRDMTVGVVGGGNSALVEAVLLAKLVKKLYIFQDLDFLTGDAKLQEELMASGNVEVICGTKVVDYLGDGELSGVKIEMTKTGEVKDYNLDGLFVAIGLVPETEPFANILNLDSRGYVPTDESCKAGIPGVFVAGDIRVKKVRQVTTAAADGAIAALAAVDYLEGRA